MPSQVTARLSAARRQRFVGRDSEKSLFHNLLTAPELPFQVLHVYGPGGVGKTTLLREFTSLAEQNNIPAFYLDARNLEPTKRSRRSMAGCARFSCPNSTRTPSSF